MTKEPLQRFVDAWGAMGSVWGVNASLARVHALLLVTEEPVGLDDIAKALGISRGNACMCLRELRSWGVIRLVKTRGDRRDYYVTEPDVWAMFFAILRERKRREFDPALEAVRETVGALGSKGGAAKRLRQMEQLMTALDGVAGKMLGNEKTARMLMSLASKT